MKNNLYYVFTGLTYKETCVIYASSPLMDPVKIYADADIQIQLIVKAVCSLFYP